MAATDESALSQLLAQLEATPPSQHPEMRKRRYDILKTISMCYDRDGGMVYDMLMRRLLQTASVDTLAALICVIRPRCKYSMNLVVQMIARLLREVQWDGRGTLEGVAAFYDERWSVVYGSLRNALLAAGSVQRSIIKQVFDAMQEELLARRSDGLWVIHAALLYLRSWASTNYEEQDREFMRKRLRQWIECDNAEIATHAAEIYGSLTEQE